MIEKLAFQLQLSRWLQYGLYMLLALVLATNGANTTLPVSVSLCLAVVLCIASLATSGLPSNTRLLILSAMTIYLLISAWIWIQVLPVPSSLAAPVWRDLASAGISAPPRISISPFDTVFAWLRLTLPIATFIATLTIFRTDDQASRAFRLIALSSAIIAVGCLVQFYVAPRTLIFAEKQFYSDSFTFAFVNRNTAATYLGVLALMLIVLVRLDWKKLDHARIQAWILHGVGSAKRLQVWPFLLSASLLLLVLISLALTKSRGGIGATAIACATMLIMLAWISVRSRHRSRRQRSLSGICLRIVGAILIAVTVTALFAPRAILRGEVQGVQDARFCVLDGLLAAAGDNWATGSGFGTFMLAFNPYRDPACGMSGVWDKAHDSYLEGFIGLGVIVIPLAIGSIAMLIYAYRAGISERRSLAAYPVAGMCGLILVLLHALVDFSLQIPGMAVFYAVFSALTVTIALGRRQGAPPADAGRQLPMGKSTAPRIVLLLFVAAAIASTAWALLAVKSTINGAPTEAFARAIDSGVNVDSKALRTLVRDQLPSARLTRCDGDVLRSTLTVMLTELDRIDRDANYEEWVTRIAATEEQVVHMLTCTPADGNLWLRLAMLRQAGGELPGEQAQLMRLAQQFSPAQSDQLVGRLAHWNRVSIPTLILSRAEVEADVRNALNYLSANDIRSVLERVSPALRPIIDETLQIITDRRRSSLAAAGLEWVEPI